MVAAALLMASAMLMAPAMLTSATVDSAPAVVTVIGLAGFVLWLVWLAAFGLTLLRDRRPAAAAEPGVFDSA